MIERLFNLNLLDGRDFKRSGVALNQGNVGTHVFTFRIFDGINEIDYMSYSEARITLSHNSGMILSSPCIIAPNRIIYEVEPEALRLRP